MPVVGNRIKVASSSTGTGNITLGSAEDGYQTFAAGGISNNDVVRYVITEGSAWEIGKATYLTSGPTLVRTSGNLLESSTGSLLNLGGSATVFVSLADVDVMQTDGGTFTGDVTIENTLVIGDDSLTSNEALVIRGDNATANAATIKIAYGDNDTYWLMLSDGSGASSILARNRPLNIGTRFADQVRLRYNNTTIQTVNSSGISVTGNITVSGTVDGRDVATDGTKLDGIEAGANVGPSLAVAIALG